MNKKQNKVKIIASEKRNLFYMIIKKTIPIQVYTFPP